MAKENCNLPITLSKSPDSIFLARHEIIDKIKQILIHNDGKYLPGHHRVYSSIVDNSSILGTQYTIKIEALKILYEPDKDILQIDINEEIGEKWQIDVKYAVGQAAMILNNYQQRNGGESKIFFIGDNTDSLKDKILIENASSTFNSSE